MQAIPFATTVAITAVLSCISGTTQGNVGGPTAHPVGPLRKSAQQASPVASALAAAAAKGCLRPGLINFPAIAEVNLGRERGVLGRSQPSPQRNRGRPENDGRLSPLKARYSPLNEAVVMHGES